MINKTRTPQLITFSEQMYAMLLVLYPASYRQEYGRHMRQVFRDICRDAYQTNGSWGVVQLWLSALLDLFISVIEQHKQEGIRMPTVLLGRFSGLILMVAGILFSLTSISQLQPGSHYSFYGIYKLSSDALLPAYILLGLGLVGLYVRYMKRFNRASKAFLLIALIAGVSTGLGWVIHWNIFILGWFIHFLFVALFGFSLRRQKLLLPYDIVIMLVGAIPFVLMMLALFISTKTGGVDGPQLGVSAVVIGIGFGWFIIGYRLHAEKTLPAAALV